MGILIFDTSVCSTNMGDRIIMEAVNDQLRRIFPDKFFLHTYSHDRIGKASYRLINSSRYSFVGGTNLLSSNMNKYNQWKVNMLDSLFINNIILMGVGWWQYQVKPNYYTKILLKRLLSKKHYHSVRDEYTKNQLKEIGIYNALNTACPTMWDLPTECNSIPESKADEVVFTLTDYNKCSELDKKLILCLKSNYNYCHFWPQGYGDLDYLLGLGVISNRIRILPPTLSAFNDLLHQTKSIDYVGTRLHAGIKALKNNRRTIIVGIDNRAIEKEKDFNMPVIHRNNIHRLEHIIITSFETRITIPSSEINIWKNQFKGIMDDNYVRSTL